MAKRQKALINFNVPKVGRVRATKAGIATTAVTIGVLYAGWNWSERIPYVGSYAAKAKNYVRMIVGAQYSAMV